MKEKRIVGPFPPLIVGAGHACFACHQSFPHGTDQGKHPAYLVNLVREPHFDFSLFPGKDTACFYCWRPLNGAKDCLIPAPGFPLQKNNASDTNSQSVDDE